MRVNGRLFEVLYGWVNEALVNNDSTIFFITVRLLVVLILFIPFYLFLCICSFCFICVFILLSTLRTCRFELNFFPWYSVLYFSTCHWWVWFCTKWPKNDFFSLDYISLSSSMTWSRTSFYPSISFSFRKLPSKNDQPFSYLLHSFLL